MRPPVPPPVPPAVPEAPGAGRIPSWNGNGLPASGRRQARARREAWGLVTAVVLLLASGAIVVAAITAWPTIIERRTVAHRTAKTADDPEPVVAARPAPQPDEPKDPASARRTPGPTIAAPEHATTSATAPDPRPRHEDNPAAARPEPPREPPAPEPDAEDEKNRAEQAKLATAAVDRSLKSTLTALRGHDLDAARRSVEVADAAVGEDPALRARVDRWQLLVRYADQLETFRRQAAESAAKGREYEIGGRTIAIVELTPEGYAYKTSGRIERGPRAELPRPIERAILAAWFAGDGRAANHIFLGIDRLLEPGPDLAAVRREWETALRGEQATAPLMPLLEDPLFSGRAGQ